MAQSTTIAQTIGFIGAGRMATALATGCLQSGLVKNWQVIAADPHADARERFSEQVPEVAVFDENQPVMAQADIVVLAVKPQVMNQVLAEIQAEVSAKHLLVSIAAGITLNRMADGLPSGTRLVRVMPNTPCLVGYGASCFSLAATARHTDGEHVRLILESVGRAYEVEERLLDAVTGLSGSGPAFVYSMIESLAAGGVAMGLPAELALELAAQTTRGAAEMVFATGRSPAELRDQVTSPGGTTLAGLEALEKLQGSAAFQQAVEAATRRSVELGH